MAGSYSYINSLGTKVETTIKINMCNRAGPMSFCMACSPKDQRGCIYYRDSSTGKHCMYWREDISRICDSPWAQTNTDDPNIKKE